MDAEDKKKLHELVKTYSHRELMDVIKKVNAMEKKCPHCQDMIPSADYYRTEHVNKAGKTVYYLSNYCIKCANEVSNS